MITNLLKYKVSLYLLVAFQVVALALAELKFYSINYTYYDFGLYLNRIYNIYNSNVFSLDGHFQPIDLVLSRLWVFDGSLVPYLLILIKQLAITSTFWILYKYVGKASGLFFLLFPTTWYVALNDFHIDCFILPISALLFVAIKSNKMLAGVFISIGFIMVKEPYALLTAAYGLLLVISGVVEKQNRKFVLPGFLLAIVSLCYFVFVLNLIIKHSNVPDLVAVNSTAYSWLGATLGQIISSIFDRPFEILKFIFTNTEKVYFLIYLFLPFFYLFYTSPYIIVLIIPMLAISLLSALPNYYAIGSHYMIPFVVPLVVSYDLSPTKLSKYFFYYSFVTLIVYNLTISPSPVSQRFLTNNSWNYSWHAYVPTSRDSKIKLLIDQNIPVDQRYSVWTQNSLITSRIISRKFVDVIADVSAPVEQSKLPDYIVLDTKRARYIGDLPCANNICSSLDAMNSLLKKDYKNIVSYDGFLIYFKL